MEKSSLKSKLNGGTKPWDPKTNPWHSDMFRLKTTRAGFRTRFVNPENVEKKELQGWSIANAEHYGGVKDDKIQDGKPLNTRVVRRGMVLMELPEEMAKAREAHIENMNRRSEQDAKARVKKAAMEVNREIGDGISVFDEGKKS
jgi:hypothetical protein